VGGGEVARSRMGGLEQWRGAVRLVRGERLGEGLIAKRVMVTIIKMGG